jgi:hypothetical protein
VLRHHVPTLQRWSALQTVVATIRIQTAMLQLPPLPPVDAPTTDATLAHHLVRLNLKK